jgi:hypothetical protein
MVYLSHTHNLTFGFAPLQCEDWYTVPMLFRALINGGHDYSSQQKDLAKEAKRMFDDIMG